MSAELHSVERLTRDVEQNSKDIIRTREELATLRQDVAVMKTGMEGKATKSDVHDIRLDFTKLNAQLQAMTQEMKTSLDSHFKGIEEKLTNEAKRTDSIFEKHEELMNQTASQREEESRLRIDQEREKHKAEMEILKSRQPVALIKNVFVPIGGFTMVLFAILGSLLYFFWPLIVRWQAGGG